MQARLLCLCVLLVSCRGLIASTLPDGFIGVWELDPAVSTVDAKTVYSSRTIRIEKTADGMRMSSKGKTVEGNELEGYFVSSLNGENCSVQGNLGPDSIALSLASPTEITFTTKLKGETKGPGKYDLRDAGAVIALTTHAIFSDGSIHESVSIFRRR